MSGDKDPFGSPSLLRKYANRITSEVSFHTLEKQNHDPKEYETITQLIIDWLAALR
jgi:hypothetical protein